MIYEQEKDSRSSLQFPDQRLTRRQKESKFGSLEKWGIYVINSIELLCGRIAPSGANKLSDKEGISNAIDLIEYGRFNNKLLNSILKPYGDLFDGSFTFPEEPVHYDILSTKVKLLQGEEIARPFNFVAINKSSDSISKVQEQQKELLFQIALVELQGYLQQNKAPINEDFASANTYPTDEKGNPINSTEKLKKYLSYSYSDILEKQANDLLQFIYKDEHLQYKFNKGFLGYLTTGCQIYCIDNRKNTISIRPVNPLYFDCDFLDTNGFIDDCGWVREIRWLPASEIHDEFYDLLSNSEVELIEDKKQFTLDFGFEDFKSSHYMYFNDSNVPLIRVARFEWKGLKKIGIIETLNPETGEMVQDIVGDDYKRTGKEKVEWLWITERWEGYRIGSDIYVGIQPVPGQYYDLNDMGITRSSYIGIVENYSLVDKMIPYQYLYNVIIHKMKLAIMRDKGTGFIIDYAQIPKKQGWDIEKWLYMLDTTGIAVINSLETDERNQGTQFNQFTSVDRTTSHVVQNYMLSLNFIKEQVAEISGISRQREGQIQAQETVGGVERSVSQSLAITEPYFYLHNELKKRIFQKIVDIAKVTYKVNTKIQYILDDLGRKFFEITDDFKASDFGVFVTNSSADLKILQSLREMMSISLQQKEITLADFITAIKSNSISEIQHILKDAEAYNQQKQQEMQQQQMQMQQEMEKQALDRAENLENIKANATLLVERERFASELELQKMKGDVTLEAARITAQGRIEAMRADAEIDRNENNILDVREAEMLKLDLRKIEMETQQSETEHGLKMEELKMKSAMEEQKMQNKIKESKLPKKEENNG